MPFFDTHTHLDYLLAGTQQPLAELIEESQQAGVEKMLVVAVQAEDFNNIEKLTALYPKQLYYGLGLHPLYIARHRLADLDLLAQRLAQRSNNLTAVAEIGLEKGVPELLTPALWQKQCEFLEAQLHLAKDNQLPVNLHSRKSHEDLYRFLKNAQLSITGVVHGFSGSYEQAKRFVDLGYKIGVGGVITYARANKTRETIKRLTLDSLLLETDSPDMPVFGFQGQPNRPMRIRETFKVLCELRSERPEAIAEQIWQTSCALFAEK
ncbi:TatD family hydrolase [Avibacterium sp. 21-599]|uniref:TatD family hydrolase n=1 Tax=Avibacterium sp. 21-599 TaxID=2911528 RepID=UPI0022485827|nr:TatD family hydrolase [Avibacterium sp. 21-599]MCW9717159.1 TatD family hydrolase [Avibacterium sp. 21-599]MCW9719108.1 TatD family hydrolase [Avibacterium sp. 21-599]